MEIVAVVSLARSVEEEAASLATDLGLTPYETAVMLRGAMPVIVFRSEDHARITAVAGKLRGRGHGAVACDLDEVVASDAMFRPKAFRFEGSDFIGIANGEERRMTASDVHVLVRANHRTRTEDVVTTRERKLSFGRAAVTGGLLLTKVSESTGKRVTDEREPVLYIFPVDGPPWLLLSTHMRYDGLGAAMRRSMAENFEVLLGTLRSLAPSAPFDTRLLAIRVAPMMVASSNTAHHASATSARTLDVLAHVVALSISARPYR
jgi:hypothetical protein